MNTIRSASTAALSLLLAANAQKLSAQSIERFDEIADDLYFVGTATHNTLLLVTDEGIIMTDPLNRQFSTVLKTEIAERFGVPVRYVLYSHHHADHASGGAVWADTATFVGHENMLSQLELPPADTPLPPELVLLDLDGSGQLERSETHDWRGFNPTTRGAFALDPFIERIFDFYNANSDDALSGAELERGPVVDVRPPDLTFSHELTVSLGGRTAVMIYTGTHTHTDDMSIVIFPDQSVGYLVDFISIVRPPRWISGDQPLHTWIDAIRIVEAQDFETAAPGHGAVGSSEYVTLFREYLEQLRDEVGAGIAAGESIEALQQRIYMDEYNDWISYDDFRPQNIADMYRLLTTEGP
jgi:glyoxylase-like metal-dependent hydrolase (beta-lactamase superfamily II)